MNLKTHRNKNEKIVGRVGFPIPLKTPLITSFKPQIKYVLDTIIIFCLENSIMEGEDVIIDESSLEKNADKNPNVAPKPIVIKIARIIACFTRLKFLAPTFCAMYGAVAYAGAKTIW